MSKGKREREGDEEIQRELKRNRGDRENELIIC